jgi:hypothetical protein
MPDVATSGWEKASSTAQQSAGRLVPIPLDLLDALDEQRQRLDGFIRICIDAYGLCDHCQQARRQIEKATKDPKILELDPYNFWSETREKVEEVSKGVTSLGMSVSSAAPVASDLADRHKEIKKALEDAVVQVGTALRPPLQGDANVMVRTVHSSIDIIRGYAAEIASDHSRLAEHVLVQIQTCMARVRERIRGIAEVGSSESGVRTFREAPDTGQFESTHPTVPLRREDGELSRKV